MSARERVRAEDGGPPAAVPAPDHALGVRLASLLGIRDAGRVLRDFAAYLPTSVVPAMVGFLALPILARRLAPTELGVLALAQTAITLGWTITGSWLTAAIVRELEGHRQKGQLTVFRRTLWRGLGLVLVALVGFGFLVAAGAVLSSAIRDNYWLIIAGTFGLILENVAAALFTASFRTRAYATFEITARVTAVGLGTILVFQGYRLHGYLVGLAIGSIAVSAIGLLFAWPRNRLPRAAEASAPPLVRPWLQYGVPASLAATVVWGLSFLDRYLLAALEDAGEVGIYTVGSVLGDKVVMVPMYAFFMAATPLLIAAFEQAGRERVEALMHSYTRVILLLGLPCVAGIAVAADEFVRLLAGEPYKGFYAPAAAVAPIVAAGSLLYALSAIGGIGLAVARRTRPLVYASVIGLAVNVGANLVLIPPLGAKGAAIATPIGWAVYLVAVHLWARGYASWAFPSVTLARSGLASALGYAAAVLFVPPRLSDLAGAAAELGTVTGVYIVVLAVTGEVHVLRRRRLQASSS